jgi:diguanylate cyclase (GGDEF)-like protein
VLAAFRTTAYLAPVFIFLALVTLLPELTGPARAPSPLLFAGIALAAMSGAAVMASAAWIAGSRRLEDVARALDEFRVGAARTMPERGVTAERRVARALNEAAAALARVEARASRDRLTGVANRETLLAVLAAEVKRSGRTGASLSLAFVDIDRFKSINDSHGHSSGDAVLRQMGELIGGAIRGSDVVGRYGGEEFMLILPDSDLESARQVAERVRELVMRTPLRIAGGRQIATTVSIGIACGAGPDMRLDALVAQADAAMYRAKSCGRNQTRVFEPPIDASWDDGSEHTADAGSVPASAARGTG